MSEDDCLMIFTKNPILGTAKTRIGKIKGDEIALQVYQRLLAFTRDTVSDLACKKVIYYNSFIPTDDSWHKNYPKRLQVSGDLGVKMSAAFKEEYPYSKRVIIIGSDCAELTSADIELAFSKLRDHDVVVGPADDGGYYLLGMNNMYEDLFHQMPWSQDNLLKVTLQKVIDMGLSYYELPTKSDIDYWEDWEKLGWVLD